VLYCVTAISFPYIYPYERSQHIGKGYNTRENVRTDTSAINLAFSRVGGLHEDKI